MPYERSDCVCAVCGYVLSANAEKPLFNRAALMRLDQCDNRARVGGLGGVLSDIMLPLKPTTKLHRTTVTTHELCNYVLCVTVVATIYICPNLHPRSSRHVLDHRLKCKCQIIDRYNRTAAAG